MAFTDELRKKAGPLEVWQWMLIGGVAIAAYVIIKRRGASTTTLTPQATVVPSGTGVSTLSGSLPVDTTTPTLSLPPDSTITPPVNISTPVVAPVHVTGTDPNADLQALLNAGYKMSDICLPCLQGAGGIYGTLPSQQAPSSSYLAPQGVSSPPPVQTAAQSYTPIQAPQTSATWHWALLPWQAGQPMAGYQQGPLGLQPVEWAQVPGPLR